MGWRDVCFGRRDEKWCVEMRWDGSYRCPPSSVFSFFSFFFGDRWCTYCQEIGWRRISILGWGSSSFKDLLFESPGLIFIGSTDDSGWGLSWFSSPKNNLYTIAESLHNLDCCGWNTCVVKNFTSMICVFFPESMISRTKERKHHPFFRRLARKSNASLFSLAWASYHEPMCWSVGVSWKSFAHWYLIRWSDLNAGGTAGSLWDLGVCCELVRCGQRLFCLELFLNVRLCVLLTGLAVLRMPGYEAFVH